jgi:hypothetical protein
MKKGFKISDIVIGCNNNFFYLYNYIAINTIGLYGFSSVQSEFIPNSSRVGVWKIKNIK